MNFAMLPYVRSETGTGYLKINAEADVQDERRGGFNGYSIGMLRPDNNGQDLLDALSEKIEYLRSRELIKPGYEMVQVESREGFATELLPYLTDLNPLNIIFRPSGSPDDMINVFVYLDKTSDALAKKDGGKKSKRSKKRRRSRKKL